MRFLKGVIFFHVLLVLVLFYYRVSEKKLPLPSHIQVRHLVATAIQEIMPIKKEEPLVREKNEVVVEEKREASSETPAPTPPVESIVEAKPEKKEPVAKPLAKLVTKSKPKTVTLKATPKAKPSKPKTTVAKAPSQKKSQKVKSEAKKPTRDKQSSEKLASLMQDALKSLNAKPTTSSASSSKAVSSKKIETLSSEAARFELTYQEKLIAYLEELLEFPEKGEARVQLTLKKNGSVEEVAILSGASEKNRRYLQNTIPKITFPSFDLSLKKKERETFFMVLTSEKH